MAKLLVIADDLTGALDTGIQFSRRGANVCVKTGEDQIGQIDFQQSDVIVINTESRHLSPQKAYHAVRLAAESGIQAGAEQIYKKTDSVLRGNIGAELKAVHEAAKKAVLFLPAYPDMERITRNGVHYCHGVPVCESSFGQDPANPVHHSRVEEIIREGWRADIRSVPFPFSSGIWEETADVFVFDCETNQQRKQIFDSLPSKQNYVLAGCAGFAFELAEQYPFSSRSCPPSVKKNGIYAVCGSINPASANQIAFAVKSGWKEVSLSAEQILKQDFSLPERALSSGSFLAVHTLQANFSGMNPKQITAAVGEYHGTFLRRIIKDHPNFLPAIIGGDTLMSFIHALRCSEMIPLFSLPDGAVLSKLPYQQNRFPVITKSGGFGKEDFLVRIKQILIPE